jgi:hypothetical protein
MIYLYGLFLLLKGRSHVFMNVLDYISKRLNLPLGREFAAIKKPAAFLDLRRAKGWGGRLSFIFDSHAAQFV